MSAPEADALRASGGGEPVSPARHGASPAPDRRAGAVWTFTVALWCGTLAGIGEAVLTTAQEYGFGTFAVGSRDHLWMTPIADSIILLALAIPAVIAAIVLPRVATRATIAAFLASIGALAIILHIPRVHWAAQIALSIGIGAQVGRLLAVPGRRLGRQIVALGIGLALVAGMTGGWRRLAERRAIAALPAARAGAPNVLLLILDTVHAGHLSLYGYDRRTTPGLERWAQRGVVFDRALSTTSWTLPSHASMFTGHYASELSADWLAPLDSTYPTLAEMLRDRGYATGGFVANLLYTAHGSGLERGFITFSDYLRDFTQVMWSASLAQTHMGVALRDARTLRKVAGTVRRFDLTDDGRLQRRFSRKHAPIVTDQFLEWQAAHRGRPFFAFLNYFDAHTPYEVPPEFANRFAATGKARDVYDGAIARMDVDVDRLLTELDRRGVLENTIVVLTADHGEYFGQHNRWGHGVGLHRAVLHVPLMIIAKGRAPEGQRLQQTVTLRDLPATILQLAEIQDSLVPGWSLAREWTSDSTASRRSAPIATLTTGDDARVKPAGRRRMWAVVVNGLYWIRGYDGTEELYQYPADTAEAHDLATDPVSRAKLKAGMASASVSVPNR